MIDPTLAQVIDITLPQAIVVATALVCWTAYVIARAFSE